MKNCIKIALVIIGALIGAGFASGQEIYLFFFSYGKRGIFGIAVSAILLGIIIYKTMIIIKKNKITTYKEFLLSIVPEKWRKEKVLEIINIIINIFILITFYIMIAGFGGYLAETIKIPQIIGSSILAIMCVIIMSKETKGIVKVSEIIVPILIVFIVVIGVYTVISTNVANKIEQMNIINGSSWLVSGVLYASYNTILLIPVLISVNNIIDRREVSKTSIVITFMIFLLATAVFVSMLKIDVNIKRIEMPVSYVISTQLSKLKVLYGIVILTSILTTAISLIAGLMQNVKEKSNKKIMLCLICISSIFISQIGFSALINFLYPIFGYIGIIQILLIAIFSIL
jgi:transporter